MKIIIQTILLLFSVSSFGQTQNTTSFTLATSDCRNQEANFWRGIDTVVFYKLPEDTIMFKVIPRQYRQSPIKLDNIPISEYKLIYRNNFNQLISKQIRLSGKETNSIVVCPDVLLEYPQNTLSKLEDKDEISINFHSQGCFHTTVSKISIIKEGKKYVARLYDVKWSYVTKKKKTTMQYRGGKLLKTITLTNTNIQDFIMFENELNFVTDGGCTTTDWYDINSKYLNISKTDGSCNWNGFYYIRKSFFSEYRELSN